MLSPKRSPSRALSVSRQTLALVCQAKRLTVVDEVTSRDHIQGRTVVERDDDPSPRKRCGDELSVLRMRCRRRSLCPAEPDAPRFPDLEERCSSAAWASWRR